jgi:serine/threonine-protein kinase
MKRDVRLLLELGRGGMGVVYLAAALGPARFTKLKVIKRLRPELAADPAAVEMFLEEARLGARLHHPNIVQTNDASFDGRHYELEMEYLEGQSYEILARRGLPVALGVYVLSQVLSGLHHAHELKGWSGEPLGIVHRDVSPHNVMVTYEGAVKLLDFGIARFSGTTLETQTGAVKGKVSYMAPEQAARGPVDRRADVFAAGVMLWQLLANRRMWGDLLDAEVLARLKDGAIPALEGAVPEALARACARALAPKPEERFATAEDMRSELEGWLATGDEETGSKPSALGAYQKASAFGAYHRDLARQMMAHFAEHRARVRAEIDEQLRQTSASRSDANVPVLDAGTPHAATSGTGVTIGAMGTRTRQAREIRGLRRSTRLAIGLALAASVAVGVFALRRRGAPTTRGATPPRACAGPAACGRELGRPAICRTDGTCVALESARCTLLAEPGDAEDARTIWLGMMFPTSGPMGEVGSRFARAAELARRDFTQMTHGIPAASGVGAASPLGLVSCDEATDAEASARHLADELRLPAVVGFGRSGTVLDLAPSVFLPRRMLVLTTNASALVTSIPQPTDAPRLVWRTGPNTSRQALPAARFVEEVLERRLGAPLRVAYLRPDATYALATTEAVLASLRFNGKNVIDNAGAFREVVFADPSGGAKIDYEPAIHEILATQPDVVLFLGEDELAPILTEVERRWPSAKRRPSYVGLSNLAGPSLLAWSATSTDLRQRFFGVTLPSKTPANAQFTLRYNETFGAHAPLDDSPGASYDAVYVFAYAAYAALASGIPRPSGPDLSRAIARLMPPGVPVDVGPTHIFEATTELRAGRSIDLVGAVTRLDYDPKTGEPASDYAIQCMGPDGAAIDSGLVLRAGDAHLTGTMTCP